jgi:hypothetical protein
MSFNPLGRITNYQSMLSRIFWLTIASALVAIWLLRIHLPYLDTLLSEIDFQLDFDGGSFLPLPGGYLLPAIAVGVLSRIFRLHSRISDWLGIRERFEIDVIIQQLASEVQTNLANVPDEHLLRQRHRLLRESFYRFVNGPAPQIDPYLVEQALDAWSWFWTGVEATVIFILAGFALVAGGNFMAGTATLGCTLLVAATGLPAMRAQCRRYAIAQARAICADPERASVVKSVLDGLSDYRSPIRRAA